MKETKAVWLGVVALACSLSLSSAQIVTLADGTSVAQVNVGSQAGMFNWLVQGQNVLNQQWFWFRVGSTGPQASIDTISAPTITLYNGTRGLTTSYANQMFSLSVDYLLTGGSLVGVGQTAVSDIAEAIKILNLSGTALDLHFFQYSDFDLGSPGGDTIQLGKNLRGLWNEAAQSDPTAGLTETVVAPGATHGEAAFFNQTLKALNGTPGYTLDDNAGPVGPGDVTWALQWDFSIAPGASVVISKDKLVNITVVPEPAAFGLLVLGSAGLFLRRRFAA